MIVESKSRCSTNYPTIESSGQRQHADQSVFDTLIRVKINAVELLRRALPDLARDVIVCGDWQQPAEGYYQLSRQMRRARTGLSPIHR